LANDNIKAASLITDQRDRDYVFSQINITEDKVENSENDTILRLEKYLKGE
jgi:2-methylaconitate cis-trans-isomerase PrpF